MRQTSNAKRQAVDVDIADEPTLMPMPMLMPMPTPTADGRVDGRLRSATSVEERARGTYG